MQTDSPSNTLTATLGTAHLAWAAILCAGGIYGLSASQPASRELIETLGVWSQAFAATGVSAIVALAMLHGWGGQSLRRGGALPGAILWGLLAAGGLLVLVALAILFRGMQSRLLLAGAAPLVAVMLAGGLGSITLAVVTRWLGKMESSSDQDDGFQAEQESPQDTAESTLLRIALVSIPSAFAAGTIVVALCCELTSS